MTFVVPNRFEHAYGLTPEIVELAAEKMHKSLLQLITELVVMMAF